MKIISFLLLNLLLVVQGQFDPNYAPGRSVIVHLFQWKYEDIAAECEGFLGPNGFAGVQVDSPAENAIVNNRPWHERSQILSYKIDQTRAGNAQQFADMVSRCNAAGVRIYVDALMNHMAGHGINMIGTAGSTGNSVLRIYPAVNYNIINFHASCSILSLLDLFQVRNCELLDNPDLNQADEYVRGKLVEYLNTLVDLGVAGFHVDSAKNIDPSDLQTITSQVQNLNTAHGFPQNARPFFYQDVKESGGEAVSKYEYTGIGAVSESLYSKKIGEVFRKENGQSLDQLSNFGEAWGFLPSNRALVFVENHKSERGDSGNQILTYKDDQLYLMAVIFGLAHPYGISRIMSSYDFTDIDAGPPMDANENILSPIINADGSCGNGYVCQHRMRQIQNMVKFRNVVGSAPVTNFWTNGDNQIAFAREGRGFIAFNNGASPMDVNVETSLPAGTYCDIISGSATLDGTLCSGREIVLLNGVSNGLAHISITPGSDELVLAIDVDNRLIN